MLRELKYPALVQPAKSVTGIKLFGDGASLADFSRLYDEGRVVGFTTNPTLMFKAGVEDYATFAQQLVTLIPDMPLSFEVFSDDFVEMERQARLIASWGRNVYVKIPITNTKGESSLPLVERLSRDGIKLNVTAILTLEQVAGTVEALDPSVPGIVSVFAGRIADTGVDPMPIMRAAVALAARKPLAEVLWASPREVLNIYQARDCGCHIITATPDILRKLDMSGKDLAELSLETVDMFRKDAVSAGFTL
ncbi:transaldolase [Caulobacter mirabilis]|uniref:Transaldolase n=1 Tax=Caulobacter mirabilis TaxID=69666 RepID=A0A2D2AZ85_9CAUL|nr:transaldolase [Caulobacter mirabilis]ATQ43291.1 transaldolase [Caulobacter mirabilis]